VEGAMTPHGLEPNALSEHDKQQILETVRVELLESDRYPRISFEGRASANAGTVHVDGSLTLRGRTLAIESDLRGGASNLWQASFELTPSRFGIAPYKALAGAIKLQDRVTIVVTVQLPGDTPVSILENHNSWKLAPASSP
jgi:polyisoprenoid-binding protein YceI